MRKELTPVAKELADKSFVSKYYAQRSNDELKIASERFFAMRAISNNDKLQQCTVQSIQASMIQLAYIGVSLNPTLAHAYLIPYSTTCTPTLSYRGLEHLAYKDGAIRDIQAVLVHKQDPLFSVETGARGRYVSHREAREERGPMTHVYCIANFMNGGQHVEVMDKAAIENIKDAAKRKNFGKLSPSWKYYEGEMWKKCCVRRAWKHWPQTGPLTRAMEVLDEIEPIESSAVTLIDDKQKGVLLDLLAQADMPERLFCDAFGVDKIESMSADQFDEARMLVKKKVAVQS